MARGATTVGTPDETVTEGAALVELVPEAGPTRPTATSAVVTTTLDSRTARRNKTPHRGKRYFYIVGQRAALLDQKGAFRRGVRPVLMLT